MGPEAGAHAATAACSAAQGALGGHLMRHAHSPCVGEGHATRHGRGACHAQWMRGMPPAIHEGCAARHR
eukprot:352712-Chlamydomonas_euryale.AAC.2